MAALRIESTYRIVSTPLVLVTAGTIPVELLAARRREIYKAKLAGKHINDYLKENINDNYDRTMRMEEGGQRDVTGHKAMDWSQI